MSALPDLAKREGLHLALGGGAARALAHIGLLRALEEARIPLASLCGTSMGALVGAVYALMGDAEQTLRIFGEFVQSDLYNRDRYAMLKSLQKIHGRPGLVDFLKKGLLIGRSFALGSVIPYEDFSAELRALLPDKRFSDANLPFFATATDLTHQKEVVFHRGFLRHAVMASCAIPGVYPAIRTREASYVDGSWVNVVPVQPLFALGAQRVVGASVGLGLLPISTDNGITTFLQAFNASYKRLQERQVERASLLISMDLDHLHWADFQQVHRAAELGYELGRAQLPALQQLAAPEKRPRWPRWLPGKGKDPQGQPAYGGIFREIWEIQP